MAVRNKEYNQSVVSLIWSNIDYYRKRFGISKSDVYTRWHERYNKNMYVTTIFDIAETLGVEPMMLLETNLDEKAELKAAYRMVAEDMNVSVKMLRNFPNFKKKIDELKILID